MPRPNQGPRLKLKRSRGSRNAKFHVIWYENGQRRERSTGTDDSKRAEKVLADVIASRFRPNEGPSEPHDLLVTDALVLYARERGRNTAAPERIGFSIEALLPFWTGLHVSAVKGETCRAYARRREVSDGTIRRELGVLRAALNHCVREGHLTVAPSVTLPPRPQARDRWLTRSEAAKLIRAARRSGKAREHLVTFILVALYTGARKGAVLSLQWQPNTEGGNVNLESRIIDFNPVGRAQTNKRRSRVPIPRRLMTFLKLARKRTRQFVLEYDGKPIGDIKKSFAVAAKGADLNGASPHALRHTAITWLVQRGVPIWEVAGYVGATPATISAVYGHHSPDHLKLAVNAMDNPYPSP